MPAKNVGKAVAKAVKVQQGGKKKAAAVVKPKVAKVQKRTPRYAVQFHRPYTLRHALAPKCPKRTSPVVPKVDHFSIIKHPLTTESAMAKIELNNTLVFIVDLRANKHQIRSAVKKMYNIKAVGVNTLVTPKGKKKAMVRLHSDHDAMDVANQIGVL